MKSLTGVRKRPASTLFGEVIGCVVGPDFVVVVGLEHATDALLQLGLGGFVLGDPVAEDEVDVVLGLLGWVDGGAEQEAPLRVDAAAITTVFGEELADVLVARNDEVPEMGWDVEEVYSSSEKR